MSKFIINCFEDGHMVLDWDPSKYKTKAGAAKSLHKALCKWCEEVGMNPDIECHIWTPEQREKHGPYGRNWAVSLEAGPYEWAVYASMKIENANWFVEPYYSFDLEFVD